MTNNTYVCSKCDNKETTFTIGKDSKGFNFNVKCVDCGHSGIIKNTHEIDKIVASQTVKEWLSDYKGVEI
tara:strand:- start:922 stop:1131 length:210 start_codon:yes stop_codon:yes gene_type:complete